MSSTNCISLINSILPALGTIEGDEIRNENLVIRLDHNRNSDTYEKGCLESKRKSLLLAHLILALGAETAEAILNLNYKNFDALIPNFGCQMTALKNQELLKIREICDEAERIQALANENLKKIEPLFKSNKFPPAIGGMNAVSYVQKAGFDLDVSPEFAQLVRYRLLTIVNQNIAVEKDNRKIEMPSTNPNAIIKMNTKYAKLPIKKIIDGIQGEESVHAVEFISEIAKSLNTPRSQLVQKLLSKPYLRSTPPSEKWSSIVSVPLVYNIEASLEGSKGTVLIKNKLFLCDKENKKRIDNAEPIQVYMKLSENRVLTSDEVKALDPSEPLIVIECYIKNNTPLIEKINEIGLMNIVRADCAILNQYASGIKDSEINDEEAKLDLQKYREMPKARDVMELEHIYCASVKEERDEFTA